ncbi:hypothetical protein TrST_g6085 [Triparma strigata]|uniref:Lipoxygenase domain-containing protein n=2 Tax=Triparma strigata TaxID=1606541 RepID=A0A9W7BSE1_9STRA|nr:hypothetical protein TrST_g6085 [Triparma strigata]
MSNAPNPKLLDLRAQGSRAVQSFMRTFGPDDASPDADSIPMTEKKERPKRYVNAKTGKEISRLKSVVVDSKGNVLMKRLITLSMVGAFCAACALMFLSGVAVEEEPPKAVKEEVVVQDDMQAKWISRDDFCMSCAHAPSRKWSWWFGWGSCDCFAGWSGACCDIPHLNSGECALYEDTLEVIHDHSVVPGIPFHKDLVTSPCSNAWSIDALGQGVAPVVVNMLYNVIDEQPPQYVRDSLDELHAATQDNSYWSLVWETLKMFARIFTDDRGAEYEMLSSLQECEGVASDYSTDSTGLTALSTMGKCYEAQMDALDGTHDEGYKPTLPEYNNFWRLIDAEESVLFAMVDSVQDTIPVAWMRNDDMFGWLRMVGSNPDMLRIANSADFGVNFDVTDAMYNTAMGESGSGTLNAALAAGRLFMMDFSIFGDGVEDNNGKFLHAPKALFAVPVDTTQRLRTVAIQQYQTPSTEHPLMGAPDPGIRDSWDTNSDGSKTFGSSLSEADKKTLVKWAMLKTSVQSAESSYFEVVTHFGRTHLVMEPFMIAANVAFHETHPIRKLLHPHFEGTLHINQGAVDALISEGGVIDKIFPPPISITQSLAVASCKDFLENFNDNLFDVAFQKRGTTTLPAEYPFRDDGMLLWNAIKDWTYKYLTIAYSSDAQMRKDPWLKCFWDLLVSPSGGMLQKVGDNNNGKLHTRRYLSEFLALIIWTSSGQHAATNFPQKDVGAHITMNPTSSWSKGRLDPADLDISNWFDMLPPLHEAFDQLNTEYLLGSVHYNRLGRYEEDYATGHFEGEYREAELEFQAALENVRSTIEARNNEAGTMRGDVWPYEILMPENTPNSINI